MDFLADREKPRDFGQMEKARGREPGSLVNGRSRALAERAETIAFGLTEGTASRRIAAMRAAGMALPPCLYLAFAVALALGAVPAIWTTAAEGTEPEVGEAGAGEPAAPTIYKWIDEHGIAHYTTDFERIPEGLRKRSGPLGPPNAALTRTPVEAGAPARRVPSVAGAVRKPPGAALAAEPAGAACPAGHYHGVQVGAFRSSTNAAGFRDRMSAEYGLARVHVKGHKSPLLYRVVVGCTDQSGPARDLLRRLRGDGVQGFVVRVSETDVVDQP